MAAQTKAACGAHTSRVQLYSCQGRVHGMSEEVESRFGTIKWLHAAGKNA